MRVDSLGLFWQDYASVTGTERERVRPPVPNTGWARPRDLPRLDAAKVIALDTETYDPRLTTLGPGFVRAGVDTPHDGYMVGLSVATDDKSWYFPLRHPDSDNFDEAKVFAWAKHELGRVKQPKVGANLSYDMGWLRVNDVDVRGALFDVQYAEPLLDENAITYELEYLSNKYTGVGKESNTLYQWCSDAFGGPANDTQRKNIWRCPAALVGPYAEGDAWKPLIIIREQIKQLKAEKLYDLFKLETSLIPLLLDMYFEGVRVDLPRAESVRDELRGEVVTAQDELDELAGFPVNCNSAASIAEAFDAAGIKYRRTRDGRPSFKKAWLTENGSPLARGVVNVRKVAKASGTFVDSYIFKHQICGRIHASFHPMRTDTNGAVSGRFASSHPNLQNIPSRDERLAPMIRSIFIPNEGAKYWRRFDYSQIEYRLLAHFASGRGAEQVRDAFRNNPDIDYHEMVTNIVHEVTGLLLDRKLTKNINFGLVYGMAEATLRNYLGITELEAETIFDAVHSGAPFIAHTYSAYMREAAALAEVRTLLGRKRRYTWYESAVAGVNGEPLPKAAAKRAYGHIKPAYTHKALNGCLQGSAADVIKQAMSDAYYAGIFDVTGVPHVQVHDELGFSDDDTPAQREAFAELTNLMQTCVKLRVPIKVDVSRGVNWGACK